MTGTQIKAEIIAYLESRGWKNKRPGAQLAWLDPHPRGISKLYCWHAAFVVELSRERDDPTLYLVPTEVTETDFPGSAA